MNFVKDAHKMFLSGSVEDKQFITQLVVSKCTYYNKKLDIELFPGVNEHSVWLFVTDCLGIIAGTIENICTIVKFSLECTKIVSKNLYTF